MPERLTNPRYWKQTTQDIEGAFAAPPKPQSTPGAFIENVQRPTDQFANQIGEQISPTLGAFGVGQLAGDTALRFSEGDYTGAAMNAPMLAMAMMPGAKGKSARSWETILRQQREMEGLRAAMRDPQTGQVYTGWTHQNAIDSAPQGQGDVWGRLHGEWDRETPNSGFIDREGNFISRDEANERWNVLTMEDVRDARKR
jgi:hypothetical protein